MSADSIARCKLALPMPELWHKLGLRGDPKVSCPSPFRVNENTPAFSVFQRKNLWFWRDHALDISGDEIDLVMMAEGSEKGAAIKRYHDLAGVPMPEPKAKQTSNNSLGKLVKIYDYRDVDGNLVHQTLRFEPKRFLQRRPAAEGMHAGGKTARMDKRTGKWWIWTLEGIEPVLYRLPELSKAPIDKPIFICEGEKDADALAELGAITTTAPMGAGKWRNSYTDYLEHRHVIICPDVDDAGNRHSQIVARSLRGRVKRLQILSLVRMCKEWQLAFVDCKIDIAEIVPRLLNGAGTA
jgi:5S rRNA maturation endonuclease (ribonuclease M5)